MILNVVFVLLNPFKIITLINHSTKKYTHNHYKTANLVGLFCRIADFLHDVADDMKELKIGGRYFLIFLKTISYEE